MRKQHGGQEALLGGDGGPHGLGGGRAPVAADGPGERGHEGRAVALDDGDGHGAEVVGVGERLLPVGQAAEHLLGPGEGERVQRST